MFVATRKEQKRERSYAWQRRCLRIGGVSLGFSAISSDDLRFSPDHESFEVDSSHCDIDVHLNWVDRLPPVTGERLFDSGAVWSLYEEGDRLAFDFVTPILGRQPYKRLWVNRDFSRAQLLLNCQCVSPQRGMFALEYPVDELLVTNWLARGRGVEVHGCGLVDAEAGSYLFVGHSGAGKSTTTRLWTSVRNASVLSDDRIILRRQGKQIWMYGTPWHGEAGYASSERAKLRSIFILEHGERNEIISLPQGRAIAELFTRCFLAFHNPGVIQSVLSYLHSVTTMVPCYQYRFVPHTSAVQTILEFHG